MSFVSKIKQLFTPNAGHFEGLTRMVDQYFDEHGGKRESYEDFKEHYPSSFDGSLAERAKSSRLQRENTYPGRNVCWIGDKGRMVRVDPSYAEHIAGNIFHPEKIAAVAAGVELHPETVFFVAPHGQMVKITLDRVRESLEYTGPGDEERLTTGDEELDEYLLDPEDYLDTYADDDDRDELREEMDERLREAEEDDEGDLGSWLFTFRDGNHRAFGSMAAGEPYVWAILMDNDYQDLVEFHESGTMTEEQRELWEMLE